MTNIRHLNIQDGTLPQPYFTLRTIIPLECAASKVRADLGPTWVYQQQHGDLIAGAVAAPEEGQYFMNN